MLHYVWDTSIKIHYLKNKVMLLRDFGFIACERLRITFALLEGKRKVIFFVCLLVYYIIIITGNKSSPSADSSVNCS